MNYTITHLFIYARALWYFRKKMKISRETRGGFRVVETGMATMAMVLEILSLLSICNLLRNRHGHCGHGTWNFEFTLNQQPLEKQPAATTKHSLTGRESLSFHIMCLCLYVVSIVHRSSSGSECVSVSLLYSVLYCAAHLGKHTHDGYK